MLEPFMGELCVHPAALDYSGNTCSHKCAYCFAQHRETDRRANPRKLIDLCFGRSRSTGIVDFLFNRGFPVCVSNRSDPFAHSNATDTPIVLRALSDVQNPVYIQTKGGKDDISLLDTLHRSEVVLYVTISTLDESIRRRVEPNAPSAAHRIELLEYALSRGWLPVCAINPCWQPWWNGNALEDFVDSLAEKGITRFILQPLHLPRAKIASPRQGCLSRLNDDECIGAETYSGPRWDWYARSAMRIWARGAKHRKTTILPRCAADFKSYPHDIRAFCVGDSPLPVGLYEGCDRWLPRRMNATQDFVDFAYAHPRRNFFTFKDFLAVMLRGNADLAAYSDHNLYKYLLCMNRSEWKDNPNVKSAATFADVYRCIWNSPRFYHSPQRRECFRPISGTLQPPRGKSQASSGAGPSRPAIRGGGPLCPPPIRDRNGDLILYRCDDLADWCEKPTPLSIEELRRKEVNVDELRSFA